MPYLIFAMDYTNKNKIRENYRDAHRKYLKSFGKKILASGALLAEDKETVIGGITLFDTEDKKEAEDFERNDPYAKAGLRQRIEIIYWRKRWWEGNFLLED